MKQTTITLNNYEEYIIDFVEHTLSEELNIEMISFLNLHPTIAEEVMSFRNIKLVPDTAILYPDTAGLLIDEPVKVIGMWKKLMAVACIGLLLAGAWVWSSGDSVSTVENQNLVEHKITTTIQSPSKPQLEEVIESQIADNQPKEAVLEDKLKPSERFDSQVKTVLISPAQNAKEQYEQKETEGAQLEIYKKEQSKPALMAAVDENRSEGLDRDVIEPIEFLPSLSMARVEEAATANDYDIVFTVVIPKKEVKSNIIKSKITGSFAFANTSMAFLPTFIHSKRKTLNN